MERLKVKIKVLIHEEDVDAVGNVQAGLASRGLRPTPRSDREAGVGCVADRVRFDLGETSPLGDPPLAGEAVAVN
jgi:hypothetical protein